MDNDDDNLPEAKIENCRVCGENDFELRAGFYYCNECGTKQEQVQAVRVNDEDDYQPNVHRKKTKLKAEKAEDDTCELTSWECYNFILRGLVEQLLTLGAKEELKLMTLQLWAAYLRRLEVAFFNKKHADLPKLGLKYKQRDAKALYNHCQKKRLKRKRRQSDNVSLRSSDASSKREYRKSKRKLDESNYSQLSECSGTYSNSNTINLSTSENSISSTTTGGSSRAIQLKFSSTARKYFKKRMPVRHLKKHEKDANGELECHSLNIKTKEIHNLDYQFTTMNMKQLFTILGIALNLIEDDIQLSDLVRYIAEGHLSNKDVIKFFPENIAKNGMRILSEIGFFMNRDYHTDKVLRDNISIFAKSVNIHKFKTPNLLALIQRYVIELDLPQDVYTYAERLFNLLPPEMKTRRQQIFPHYEARCMAYIIFVLKLFFGLDGHRDKIISDSSKTINKRLEQITAKVNAGSSSSQGTYPQLFVWDEWVEYIEMRTVILSQYSTVFAERYKERQNLDHLVQQMTLTKNKRTEADLTELEATGNHTSLRVTNIQRLFENFHAELLGEMNVTVPEIIEFQASLTPAHTYFKRVLLHHKTANSTYLKIPDFMRVDHSGRTLAPHLDTRPLSHFLKSNGIELKVELIPCPSERNYVGIFGYADEPIPSRIRALKADYDINTDDWIREVKAQRIVNDHIFKTELDTYKPRYLREMELRALKKTHMHKSYSAMAPRQRTTISSSMHSLDVFNENNMDPLKHIALFGPRDNLDDINILAGVGLDERLTIKPTDTASDIKATATAIKQELSAADAEEMTESITFATSAFDQLLLLGSIPLLDEHNRKILLNKLPRSFVWLLEYCSHTIGIDWSFIYEQLLVIEIMYAYGIENLDDFKDFVRYKHVNPIKDINTLVQRNRHIW